MIPTGQSTGRALKRGSSQLHQKATAPASIRRKTTSFQRHPHSSLSSSRFAPLRCAQICELWDRVRGENWDREFQRTKYKNVSAFELVERRRRKVFANNDVSLREIEAYGFDYDYTLAFYNQDASRLIYDCIMRYLVEKFGYPTELMRCHYDPHFCRKGIQYDRMTGCLLKLDQFYKVGLGTTFYGRRMLEPEEILQKYGSFRVSMDYVQKNMKMLADLFAVPEGCALADVIDTLTRNNVQFEPSIISQDVEEAVRHAHTSGIFHDTIGANPEKYITLRPKLPEFFRRLKDAGQHTFIVTNSQYNFVNAGSEFLMQDCCKELGVKKWTDIFDYIITDARKPNWFAKASQFRELAPESGRFALTSLPSHCAFENKQKLFSQGSMKEFTRMTGYTPENVIYFGDNIPTDLQAPATLAAWKTVGIVHELKDEIRAINSPTYRSDVVRLLRYDFLLEECGKHDNNPQVDRLKKQILVDRKTVIDAFLMAHFNSGFGSIFRSFQTRSLFAYLLGHHCDLYASSVVNFLHYPLHASFHARRNFYSHEPNLWLEFSDILDKKKLRQPYQPHNPTQLELLSTRPRRRRRRARKKAPLTAEVVEEQPTDLSPPTRNAPGPLSLPLLTLCAKSAPCPRQMRPPICRPTRSFEAAGPRPRFDLRPLSYNPSAFRSKLIDGNMPCGGQNLTPLMSPTTTDRVKPGSSRNR